MSKYTQKLKIKFIYAKKCIVFTDKILLVVNISPI